MDVTVCILICPTHLFIEARKWIRKPAAHWNEHGRAVVRCSVIIENYFEKATPFLLYSRAESGDTKCLTMIVKLATGITDRPSSATRKPTADVGF
jgi:hypothetical protein